MTNTEATKMTPEQLRVWLELRRGGGAGRHGDRRTKRLRSRGARKRAAIREG